MCRVIISLIILMAFSGCHTTRISVVDGYVVKKEKIIGFKTTPDTIYYIILWNGDVITEAEFDRRWDKAVNKTTKKLKKQYGIK